MKKIFSVLLIISILISVTVMAQVPEQAYLCTVNGADLSGENYQIFFSGCRGHYENDAVTLYITNTSKKEIEFQVVIGFSGNAEVPTTVESGYVTLGSGVTGKFVLENLFNVHERANTELGYVPDSHLSQNSVVRVQARGIKAGDTFIVCGMYSYQQARDTSFSNLEAGSVIPTTTNYGYITDARLVIKKEAEEKETETTEYTLTQPDSQSVKTFLIIVVSSAIVCVGGIIIYTFTFITKRRENDD